MLSQTAFNIAGHYHQHFGEVPKQVFQQLCPILHLKKLKCMETNASGSPKSRQKWTATGK